jgi:adenylate cyclase
MFHLSYKENNVLKTFPLQQQDTVKMGRSSENELVLQDYGVSRFHAKIVRKDDGFKIIDLMSRNGTKINGVLISEKELKDGDTIELGRFPIKFEKIPEEKVVLSEDKTLAEGAGTIIRPLTHISDRITPKPFARKREIPEIKRKDEMFYILSQIAKTLISAETLDEILENVMDIVFEYFPADRGFLMLYDEDRKSLQPKVVKQKEKAPDGDKITISKTIADKVFQEKVSILTADAQIDSRFNAAASIRFQGIRSAMCVPLWDKDDVIGIIHIDSAMHTNEFSSDDLDLLSALANYAAVAIQRARLTENMMQEKKVRIKLERYHSPEIVNFIIDEARKSSSTGGEVGEREVSILFSDIAGFTPISEGLEPHEIALLLNKYFTWMTDIIFQFNGTLDKYIGDAIMAVFGAPISQKDHAKRAAKVALSMQEKINEMNQKGENDFDLQIRIGINSGRVVAGDIGSPKRIEYTVLGDCVNVASRLEEDIAKPGEIIVGENTYKYLRNNFILEDLGKTSIRGLTRKIGIYKLLDEKKRSKPS